MRPLIDAAARDVGVLRLERPRDVVDREVVGVQAIGIDPDVDLSLASAEDEHLADAVSALEPPPEHLVRVLGDVADRLPRGDGDRQDRRGVGILLLDRRLRDRPRQERQDPVDAIADFLRGHVGVLLQKERDDDLRDAFGRIRAELIDAADGVDGFLDFVGDLALDLLGRRARQTRRDGDGREVHLRQPIDAELAERECADDGQREDEDRGKNRTANAELSEPLHDSTYFRTVDGRAPSTSCSTLLVATFSPALRPVLISTRSSTDWPTVTMRSSARSPDHDVDARRSGDRAHGSGGDEHRRPLRRLLDPGRGKRARLQDSRIVRDQRFDDEGSRIGLQGRRHVAHLAFELLAGRGIDLERHRPSDRDLGRVLLAAR